MLPKFASHVFHHTQRAAQNSALRNVLGLGQNQAGASASASSTGPLSNWTGAASASSSGGTWSGAGGAKYNTGSRFYQGYTGAGRAVTQANSTSAHDSTNGRTDDDEELNLSRSGLVIRSRPRASSSSGRGRRPRSSSLHLTGTGVATRAETFGVLRTIQLHQARNSHVLSSKTDDGEQKDNLDLEPGASVERGRVLVRRNSTAGSNASDIESLESLETIESSPKEPATAVSTKPTSVASQNSSLSVDPSTPQSVLPPKESSTSTSASLSRGAAIEDALDNVSEPYNREFAKRLDLARQSGDATRVVAEVQRFRSLRTKVTVKDYNNALYALVASRQGGEPITLILETYNDMLTRQIAPSVRTYKIMVLALCERDREVERVCTQIEWRQHRRRLAGRDSGSAYATDQRHLDLLKKEDNFGSAMLVFEAAQTLYQTRDGLPLSLGTEVYSALLRSCMIHANTDAAVRIWGAIESIKDHKPEATCYLHLLGTYVNANDVDSARDVFDEFRLAAQEGRVGWPPIGKDDLPNHILSDELRSGKARAAQMLMYVKMVEAYFRAKQPHLAVELLETMMDSSAPIAFGPTDVPLPCTSIYSAFIRGFVEMDDMPSALSWFEKMLKERDISRHPLMPTARTPRPDQNAWNTLLEALIDRKMLEQANDMYAQLVRTADVDALIVRMYDRIAIFALNVEALKKSDFDREAFRKRVDFVNEYIIENAYSDLSNPLGALQYQLQTFADFLVVLMQRGQTEEAFNHLDRFLKQSLYAIDKDQADPNVDNAALEVKRTSLQNFLRELLPRMVFSRDSLSPAQILNLQNVIDSAHYKLGMEYHLYLLRVYNKLRERNQVSSLEAKHWRVFSRAVAGLLMNEAYLIQTSEGKNSEDAGVNVAKQFLRDVRNSGFDVRTTLPDPSPRLINWMIKQLGEKDAYDIFEHLGNMWTRAAMGRPSSPRPQALETEAQAQTQQVFVDRIHSRHVDEYFPLSQHATPHVAWSRYEEGKARNVYPTPDVIGRLIATFGRLGDLAKVTMLYEDAQRVLVAYENDKDLQSLGWYAVEDQMIVALAHAGHVDKAHVHRQRIIDQGGNPSADAYGALIQCVRETTDDSTNALALWHESQMRGVVANLYLYNTVISKLSRARKADFALELFQHMKANYVRPSSVTYGAVIAACCRVGDAQSAEVLFEEMISQKNFKPRVPPYNTMIQFYTHIVRDRERALHYFGSMLTAGISPTAHTYKLLIDCYGTIEPADVHSMEDVFMNLCSDRRVQVQGVHWAALINAWGCVQKDLAKAMDIFDSIATHPATQRSGLVLPDAIVYEAMINVLVTLRRTDLISMYLERLRASGIHMTAYIANLLIKGYATAGDLDRAREVFESLQDPPVGQAAPNNHVPHTSGQLSVPPTAPVYREPSTWEAMVRAELGNGNRDRATALLQRVQERHFPPAVYARISGIMLNDSVSPWSSMNVFGIMDQSSESHNPQ